MLHNAGLGRAMAWCRQEEGASARSRARKEHKQRRGRRHYGHRRQRRCVMAGGRGRRTKQQRTTVGMGGALVCARGVEHERRGKAVMKQRDAWRSRPSMGSSGSLSKVRERAGYAAGRRRSSRKGLAAKNSDEEGERGGCAVAGDELSRAATMAAGRRHEDCGCGCRRSGACRWRRNDDGAEQRERTGGAPEETPLREREENFLSLDRVR